jgi:hypothetical protein
VQIFWSLGIGPDLQATAGAWTSGNKRTATGETQVIGTLNATWYITGVQLEVGSVATPFERRPYGTELALCQRYYFRSAPTNGGSIIYTITMHNITAVNAYGSYFLPVTMRANPTLTTTGTAGDYGAYQGGTQITCNTVPSIDTSNNQTPLITYPYTSGTLTIAGTSLARGINSVGFLGFNAEL